MGSKEGLPFAKPEAAAVAGTVGEVPLVKAPFATAVMGGCAQAAVVVETELKRLDCACLPAAAASPGDAATTGTDEVAVGAVAGASEGADVGTGADADEAATVVSVGRGRNDRGGRGGSVDGSGGRAGGSGGRAGGSGGSVITTGCPSLLLLTKVSELLVVAGTLAETTAAPLNCCAPTGSYSCCCCSGSCNCGSCES